MVSYKTKSSSVRMRPSMDEFLGHLSRWIASRDAVAPTKGSALDELVRSYVPPGDGNEYARMVRIAHANLVDEIARIP